MRQGSKTLLAVVAALLLALGLVACGGDDSDSGSTEATAQTQTSAQQNGQDSSSEDSKEADGGAKTGGSDAGRESQPDDSGDGEAPAGSTPKKHEDSGGGSEQFHVKGGDNSVQEFGKEADASERAAAAAALHNFLDARAAGEWATACVYLSDSGTESLLELGAQAGMKGASCAEVLKKFTNPAPAAKEALRAEAEQANVGSLRAEGDRGFVIYRATGDEILAMPMKNEGGEWKVNSLGPTPLN